MNSEISERSSVCCVCGERRWMCVERRGDGCVWRREAMDRDG